MDASTCLERLLDADRVEAQEVAENAPPVCAGGLDDAQLALAGGLMPKQPTSLPSPR